MENKYNENLIEASVPIPLKTKMIIPLTFHLIDFDLVCLGTFLFKTLPSSSSILFSLLPNKYQI